LTFIDLGDCESVDTWVHHSTGTPVYAASEIANTKVGYSIEKADIYALGITMMVILFQDLPFGRIDRA
jgi:serine/threonine protein kinase